MYAVIIFSVRPFVTLVSRAKTAKHIVQIFTARRIFNAYAYSTASKVSKPEHS